MTNDKKKQRDLWLRLTQYEVITQTVVSLIIVPVASSDSLQP